jgi:pSer/pThr/pTyr-binding forkhead associated (FHA) protein
MPNMIVSIDGVVIKDVQLTKERTTLGRRPYNDVVIDNLAVSGEHAVVHLRGDEVEIEDLGSTNGTYVNGKPVKRQELFNGDVIEVGKYKVRFLHEERQPDFEKTMLFKPGMVPSGGASRTPFATPLISAYIKVLSGAASGREVDLTKIVTTIGKPGVAVASITKRPHGFVLTHVEGNHPPSLNGSAIGMSPTPLQSGDVLELAGTQMQFMQR